jgi:hypothetical protein
MKKSSYFLALILFFQTIFSLSCTDHDLQELPDVETLIYGNNCHALFTYNINVRNIGTQPIKEYGVVVKLGTSLNPPDLPTVADTKIVFPDPIKLGPISHLAGGACYPLVYYRSYVMLESGVVIYGNYIRFYDT